MPVIFVNGDALNPPKEAGKYILAHCCNNVGKMGSGFAAELIAVYPEAKDSYLSWFESKPPVLGDVLFVTPNKKSNCMLIAHIIGQNGVRSSYNKVPLVLPALLQGLSQVMLVAREYGLSVGPRLGSGLAGGKEFAK